MSATDYNQLQLVAFTLGAEEYAVPVQSVEGIIKLSEPTKVPGAAAHIRGVMNLRGKVISVFDLRCRFGLPSLEDETDARVLVISDGNTNVGMLVDSVSEVLTLDSATVQQAPPEVVSGHAKAIAGICRIAERLIIILDLAAVLEDDVHEIEADVQSVEAHEHAVEAPEQTAVHDQTAAQPVAEAAAVLAD